MNTKNKLLSPTVWYLEPFILHLLGMIDLDVYGLAPGLHLNTSQIHVQYDKPQSKRIINTEIFVMTFLYIYIATDHYKLLVAP